MAVVDISIGKRTYQLKCGDGQEERLRHLAREVGVRIEKLIDNQVDPQNETLLLVMAALMLQDELDETRAAKTLPPDEERIEEEINLAVAEALEAISGYVESIAERIENR